jgi:predicted dehydrogenase
MSDENDTYTIFSGSQGTARLDPLKVTKVVQGSLVNMTPEGKQHRPQDLFKKSYELEIDHFYKSLSSRAKLISTGEEGVTLMKVIEATYHSAAEGREIVIGEE